MVAGLFLGTLSFGTRTRKDFTEEEISFMKAVADLVVTAIERKRAQAALQLTAEEVKRSNRDLEQFAYIASHDLQEPLRAVGGYVKLLQRRFPQNMDPKALEYINGAAEGADRMERLICDLLAFSRVGTHGGTFSPAPLDAILNQALHNLQSSIESTRAKVTCDPLPTLTVDATQIDADLPEPHRQRHQIPQRASAGDSCGRPKAGRAAGSSRFETTASASNRSILSAFSRSSNACTRADITPAPALAWPSARRWSSATTAPSGSSPSRGAARHSSFLCRKLPL